MREGGGPMIGDDGERVPQRSAIDIRDVKVLVEFTVRTSSFDPFTVSEARRHLHRRLKRMRVVSLTGLVSGFELVSPTEDVVARRAIIAWRDRDDPPATE